MYFHLSMSYIILQSHCYGSMINCSSHMNDLETPSSPRKMVENRLYMDEDFYLNIRTPCSTQMILIFKHMRISHREYILQ